MDKDWGWIDDIVPLELNPGVEYIIDCTIDGFDEDAILSKMVELFGDQDFTIGINFNWFGNETLGHYKGVYLYLTYYVGGDSGLTIYGGWNMPTLDYDEVVPYIGRGHYMTMADFLGPVLVSGI